MKIFFRADGNEQVGAGHIMRCLSIAGKAKELGMDCVFLTADASYCNKILDAGIKCVVFDTDFRKLEGELPQLLKQIDEEKPDRIIVDSYYVTEGYLRILKERVLTVYLDDIAAFAYPVDILINYNIYSLKIAYFDLYKQAQIPMPKVLLGPQFTPLRKEFQRIPTKETSEYVRNIFVSAGGSDPEHIVMKMIEYLTEHKELTDGKRYHFVIGDFEPDKDKIIDMALRYNWIVPHCRVKGMAELMLSCDIAVSAAGSTLYELCACGIPTVTYVLADNQILGADTFQEKNLMKSAGDYRLGENWVHKLFEEVEKLCSSKVVRKKMSEEVKKLVDGKGAENIVCAIL